MNASKGVRRLAAVPCVLALALGAVSCGGADDEPLPPNVLLISIDSLRADHLGCYGYRRATSPAIDALGREGVVFESAVSQAPWTLPSHASLFTSLYGRTHQTNDISRRLPPEVPTLASTLRREGYETAGVVSGTFMKTRFGLNSGFAHYDDEIAEYDHKRSHQAVTSPSIHGKAEALLEDIREPFFMFLHYWDVHYDYDPPAPYDTKFDPDYRGTLRTRGFLRNKRIHPGMPRADLDHVVALYDGEIAWVDSHIGMLMDLLRAKGLDERTIVILTADHGDEFFEHGSKGHSHSLYDELVHVPLIMRGPGMTPGLRVATPVELLDVMPTILELVGTPRPAELHGRSLASSLTGEPVEERAVFSETTRARTQKSDPWTESWSVRLGAQKYIEHGPGPKGEAARPAERYDLVTDAGEQLNRVPTEGAEGLAEALAAWMDRIPLGKGVSNEGVDEGTMSQLKEFGYAGDD